MPDVDELFSEATSPEPPEAIAQPTRIASSQSSSRTKITQDPHLGLIDPTKQRVGTDALTVEPPQTLSALPPQERPRPGSPFVMGSSTRMVTGFKKRLNLDETITHPPEYWGIVQRPINTSGDPTDHWHMDGDEPHHEPTYVFVIPITFLIVEEVQPVPLDFSKITRRRTCPSMTIISTT
jgi:hypothetical protein